MNNEFEFFKTGQLKDKTKDDNSIQHKVSKTEYAVITLLIFFTILCGINTKPVTTEIVSQSYIKR